MRRVFPTILALLAVFLLGWSPARADYELNQVSRLYSHWDVTYGAALVGDHALIANGDDGMAVVNVSDWEWMYPVAELTTAGSAQAVAAQGDIVFVANGATGLLVVDLSDPIDPVIISQLALTGTVRAITLNGSRAYLGYSNGNSGGIHIVDIALPESPQLLGSLPITSPVTGVTIHYPTLYVTAGSGGLRLIQVDDPSQPEELSSIPNFVSAQSVAVRGDYAYVADGAGLLSVIDVSDQSNPFPVNSIGTLEGLSTVMIELADDNIYAHVADANAFRTINVTNPDDLDEMATLAIMPDFDNPRKLFRTNDTLLLTNGSNGMLALNISDLADPVVIAEFHGLRDIVDVAFAQHYAYVVDGLDGLRVVDVHDVNTPYEMGGMDRVFTHVITPDSTKLVGIGQGAMVVYDLTDPGSPQQIASLPFSGTGRGITVSDGFAYIAAGVYGMYVVNVSNWANPSIVGSSGLPANASADGVALTLNGLVVLSESTGLHLFNVSNPQTPQWLTSWSDLDNPHAIAGKGGDVMVAWGEDDHGGLARIGVSLQGFFFPKHDDDWGMPAVDVRLEGDLAMVSHLDAGISVWSTAGLWDLVFENSVLTANRAHAIDFHNNLIFVADEQHMTVFQGGGAATVEVDGPSLPAEFFLSPTYPNPFNAAARSTLSLPTAASVTVTLYDVLGRQVRVLLSGEHAAGRYPVFVDGSSLATGTYFLRATGWNGAPQTQRITLVK